MRMIATSITATLLLLSSLAHAQDNAKRVKDAIDGTMAGLAGGGPVKMVKQNTLMLDPNAALEALEGFAKSTSPKVRHFACNYTNKIGRATDDKTLRTKAVQLLVAATDDPEPLVWQHAAKNLLRYDESDFSADAIALITERITAGTARREDYRLAGVAQITALLPALATALINEQTIEEEGYPGRWFGTPGWAARLARARMGVQADIDRCIALVQAEPDEVTRVGPILLELGYIKQDATLKVLAEYVASDQHLPPTEPIFEIGVAYAQYAMDVVTESFEGCPVPKKFIGAYSQEEIAQVLNWIEETTNN